MTLIARNLNHFAPSMVADLLLTAKKITVPIILPSIGIDISGIISFVNGQPVALTQKIYVLNKNICIGLAGRVVEMKGFLEDFRIFCSAVSELNEPSVRKFLSDYDYSGFEESAYFVMLIERRKNNMIHVTEFAYGDFAASDNIIFEHTRAIGTGSEDFLSFVGEPVEFSSSFRDGELAQAMVKNLALIARLLVSERYTWENLNNQWGGGFEWAFYDGRTFQKMDQVAYILHQGGYNENAGMEFILPIMVLFYQYHGDFLKITAIQVHDLTRDINDKMVLLRSNDITVASSVVPPLWSLNDIPAYLKEPKSFETYRIAMGYAISTPSKKTIMPSLYTFSKGLKIEYFREENIFKMHMSIKLHDMLTEKFSAIYKL